MTKISLDDPTSLLAFSHMTKTGGQTLRYLLRRHFGWRHLDILYRTQGTSVYRARDLSVDLRLFPSVRSIAGHSLKPFEDFSSTGRQLVWFTMLRDPDKRFLSHYRHQVTKSGKRMGLRQWAETYRRSNWQVRMLAGDEDVEAAKEILTEKFQAVLFQDDYDLSLHVLRHQLGLKHFSICYSHPRNIGDPILKLRIDAELDANRDVVDSNNALDRELYQFARTTLWPRQVDKLPQDSNEPPLRGNSSFNLSINYLRRNLIYKPFHKIDCFFERRSNR